jgi:hypothetical protein
LGQRSTGARKADALTVWVKADKRGKVRTTGNLDIGGSMFPLAFKPFFGALQSIPQTQANAEWHKFMASTVADEVLKTERALDGIASRSTLSGLHAANDTHAFKNPVEEQQAIILYWEQEKPVAATIIDGQTLHTVSLKQETNDRFKGAVKLALGA